MWRCSSCGLIVNGGCDPERHECDPRSVIRVAVAQLDASFGAFLESPAGKLAVLMARRTIGRADAS